MEPHERAHPPHPLGQGIAEQPYQQGREILRSGRNFFIVRRGAAAGTGIEGRNLRERARPRVYPLSRTEQRPADLGGGSAEPYLRACARILRGLH